MSCAGDLKTPQVGRPGSVPMLDASLCNVVGSPISPPDGHWAEGQHPGMRGSVNSRPARMQTTSLSMAAPDDEGIHQAKQALSIGVHPYTSISCSTHAKADLPCTHMGSALVCRGSMCRKRHYPRGPTACSAVKQMPSLSLMRTPLERAAEGGSGPETSHARQDWHAGG